MRLKETYSSDSINNINNNSNIEYKDIIYQNTQ